MTHPVITEPRYTSLVHQPLHHVYIYPVPRICQNFFKCSIAFLQLDRLPYQEFSQPYYLPIAEGRTDRFLIQASLLIKTHSGHPWHDSKVEQKSETIIKDKFLMWLNHCLFCLRPAWLFIPTALPTKLQEQLASILFTDITFHISNDKSTIIIIIHSFRVFHISVSWWSFTGVWVTASLQDSSQYSGRFQ